MDTLLAALPPLQRCGRHEGWFLHTIDEHRLTIEALSARLPPSSRPTNEFYVCEIDNLMTQRSVEIVALATSLALQ